MNLAELKAIDSRRKRVAAGESIREVYGGISAEPALDSVRMIRALYDPTPVDYAWLRELGAFKQYVKAPTWLICYADDCVVRWNRSLVRFESPFSSVTTRGQLLFLLLGLGVFDE